MTLGIMSVALAFILSGCAAHDDENMALMVLSSSDQSQVSNQDTARAIAESLTEAGFPSVAGIDPRDIHVRASQIQGDNVANALKGSGPVLRSPTVQHLLSDVTRTVRQSQDANPILLSSAPALTQLFRTLDLVVQGERETVRPGDLSAELPEWWSLTAWSEQAHEQNAEIVVFPANTPNHVIQSASAGAKTQVVGRREVLAELRDGVFSWFVGALLCLAVAGAVLMWTRSARRSRSARSSVSGEIKRVTQKAVLGISLLLGLIAGMSLPTDVRRLAPFDSLTSVSNFRSLEKILGSTDVLLVECNGPPGAEILKRIPSAPGVASDPTGSLAILNSSWMGGMPAPVHVDTLNAYLEQAEAFKAPEISFGDQLDPFARLIMRRLDKDRGSSSADAVRPMQELYDAAVSLSDSLGQADARGERLVQAAYQDLRGRLIRELTEWNEQHWPEPSDLPDAAWLGEGGDDCFSFSVDKRFSRSSRHLSRTSVRRLENRLKAAEWEPVSSRLSRRVDRFDRHVRLLVLGLLAIVLVGRYAGRRGPSVGWSYAVAGVSGTALAAAIVGFGQGSWNIWSITTLAIAPWWFSIFLAFRGFRRLTFLVAVLGVPALVGGPVMAMVLALTLPLALIGWCCNDESKKATADEVHASRKSSESSLRSEDSRD